jgi:hypothetical protein
MLQTQTESFLARKVSGPGSVVGFVRHFELRSHDDSELLVLQINRQHLSFALDETEYHSIFLEGKYRLKSGNDVLPSPFASLRNPFLRFAVYECDLLGEKYALQPRLIPLLGSRLFAGKTRVGGVRSVSAFREMYVLEAPARLDLTSIAFIFWFAICKPGIERAE